MMDRSPKPSGKAKERGAVLIAALLLVALMAGLSVQIVDQTRFAIFRAANVDMRSDAYWQAVGARAFAEGILLDTVDDGPMRSDLPWLAGPQVFPTETGVIEGRVRDSANCLNVNALARADVREDTDLTDTGADVAVTRAGDMFDVLMTQIGAPPGAVSRLKVQIIDWIDSNARPEPGGAEDDLYARFNPPYRAANQRLVELEEILALPDANAELYAALRPWLCALPVGQQPALNINSLDIDQAALLSAALNGRLSLSDAEAVLFRRPPQGYDAIEDFWADPLVARLELTQVDRQAVSLRSRWFVMEVEVTLAETRFELSQLVELQEGGTLTRHLQRFGPAS